MYQMFVKPYILNKLPKRIALGLQFRKVHGYWPNLDNPRNFSEKVQYRKLFDHDPLIVTCSDKVLVKQIIRERFGDDVIIPTVWHGRELPPRDKRNWPIPYVIKANHGCGWNLFIRRKQDEDWDKIEPIVKDWLTSRFSPHLYEPGYDRIQPQVIIEPFIGRLSELPTDYKFFVFGGRVEFVMAQVGRHKSLEIATFNRDWVFQELKYSYPIPAIIPDKPSSFEKMLFIAETIGQDFSFVRVDLYEIDGIPLFGEMTFTPGSGYETFDPPGFNEVFGNLWDISSIKRIAD